LSRAFVEKNTGNIKKYRKGILGRVKFIKFTKNEINSKKMQKRG
jgi:hypothetical protein